MRSFAAYMISAGLLILTACDPNRIYEKNQAVEESGWSYEQTLEFNVLVPDTVAAYNIYFNARHTEEYGYNNIWVQLKTMLPDSTVLLDKVQVTLATPEGKWNGNCLDGICYHSVLIRQNVSFPQAGMYTFWLVQDMRENPLPGLLDVGLRMERL